MLNTYTRVSANAAAGTTTITVASSALNGGAFAGNLAAGDYIMIMQMQGATINTGNTVDYGSILNYNSAGLYEFVCVASVPNSTTINVTTPLINSYTAAGHTQVIRVPRFTTLTVSGSGSITATSWDGNIGGVVAIEATGLVTLSTTPAINVTGRGFRGGVLDNNSSAFGSGVITTYRSSSSNDGAEKGEGIAGFQAEYDLLNGRYGRGAAANGGGGGNGHNAGGDKDWRQTLSYVTISGSVINDYDGTKTLTGSETVLNGTNSGGGLLAGAVLYVNMIGPDGNVVAVAPVQADGSYSVSVVPALAANLEFQLSTTAGTVGNPKPATTLPAGWAATGENKNGYGGAADVVNNAELPFTASTTGFSGFIFGLDRKPVATAQNDLIGVGLDVGETYELDNNPMAATDAEDGTLGTGSTFMITTLPPSADATLNYDGVDITTPNFVITNYDPAKLNIRFNQLGVLSTSFGYTAIDAAGIPGDAVNYNLTLGIALPATGLQLQASNNNQQVLLQWSTLTEQQTAYFEVELSYNGTSFTKLAQVAAAGNSNTLRKYQYVTGKPAGTQWYYRVKLVDKDGKVSYSNVAVLTGNVNATMVAVLPNPASSKVTVTGLGNAKQLVIANAAGAIVQRYNVTASQMELNIASLPDGMYVIRILQSDGSTQVLKLMKR